jgi:deoxyribonuclease I
MLRRGAGKACGFRASLTLALLLAAGTAGATTVVGCGGGSEASEDTAELNASGISRLVDAGDGGDIYAGTEGLRDQALKTALLNIVKDHRSLGYNRARGALLKTPTLNPGKPLECVYTGRIVQPDGTTTPGDFNTEHSWPQSLGANNEPARSDLHHLFPVDARANSARGNYPFGEVTCLAAITGPDGTVAPPPECSYENGGSALGRTTEGQLAFEVRPQKRGDIARAQFYFSIRYKRAIAANVEVVLRDWHRQDPVDDDERTRNDSIERQQRNRNPFIDHSEFVDRIADF